MSDWILIGRYWYNEKTGRILPVIQGGALPATDAFTDDDWTGLTTHSANWTLNGGGFDIYSNQVSPANVSDNSGAHWNAESFADDQYAEIVLSTTTTGFIYIGAAVRVASGATETYYGFYANSSDTKLVKLVAGSETQLGSDGAGLSADDVVRIEASGTTITPLVNDVEQDPPGAQTDATIESGSGGICGYGANTTVLGDDWEAGDLAAGDLAPSVTDNVTLGESVAITGLAQDISVNIGMDVPAYQGTGVRVR